MKAGTFIGSIHYGITFAQTGFWGVLATAAGAVEDAAGNVHDRMMDRMQKSADKLIKMAINDLNEVTEDLCVSMNA